MLQYLDDPTCMLSDLNELTLDAPVVRGATNLALDQLQMNENTLDVSSRSTSLDSALPSDKTGPEIPSHMDSNVYFPSSENQVGRRIFKVVLKKDMKQGIGITIVGGETTNSLDLGIFVKSVVPGGPAALNGRIKPGDRLIAIGGTSLEGKQHHEAVALIRDAGQEVELLISQIKPPGTLRRQNDYFEQVEFEKKLRNSMIDRNFDNSLLEADDSIDYNTAKEAVAMRFLQFDDILDGDKADTLNDSSSFPACNSDEENFHLESPSITPPPPPLPSKSPPGASLFNLDDYKIERVDRSMNSRDWHEMSEKMERIMNENMPEEKPVRESPKVHEYNTKKSSNVHLQQMPSRIHESERKERKINTNVPIREWPEADVGRDPIFSTRILEGLEVPVSPMSQISNEFPATSLSRVREKTVVPSYNQAERENPIASFSHLQVESTPTSHASLNRVIPETSISRANERVSVTGMSRVRMASPISSFSQVREEGHVTSHSPVSCEIPETSVRNANEKSSVSILKEARKLSPVSSFSQVREEIPLMSQSPVSKDIPNTSFSHAQEKSPSSPLSYVVKGSPITFFSNVNEEDSLVSNSPIQEDLPITSFGQVREEIPITDSLNQVIREVPVNSLSFISEEGEKHLVASMLNQGDDIVDSGRGSNEDLEDILKKLRADKELALELSSDRLDWNDPIVEDSSGFYQSGLTEEEKGDLQILGDIAALEAEASSSDSDFDTAIKNTVDGSRRNKHTRKAVHPVSPMRAAMEASEMSPSESGQDRNEVIYEIILERKNKNDSFGIITETVSTANSPNGALFIKELVLHSPAQEGGILKCGDKMLEINGQRVTGLSAAQAHAVLDSPLDFCTVKVSRSANEDTTFLDQDIEDADDQEKIDQASSPEFPPPPAYLPMVADSVPLANLIPSVPTEKTQPLDDRIDIVPPPPPIKLGLEESDSNNTQSDVDSDVLDSSRSELEGIYKYMVHGEDDTDLTALEKISKAVMSQDTLEVRPAGEKVFGIGDEVQDASSKAKSSPSNLSVSSASSSNDSIVIAPSTALSKSKVSKEFEIPTLHKESISNNPTESEFEGVSHDEEDGKSVIDIKRSLPFVSDGKLPGGLPQDSSASNPEPDYSLSESEEKSIIENSKHREKYSKVSYDPELVEVTLLRKDGGGFGFTVAGGMNTGGCYIKQLVAAPAAQSGTILPGDKILMVNDKDTTKLSHTETVSMLRKGPDEVTLKLLRYPPGVESQERLMMLKNLAGREKLDQESDGRMKDQNLVRPNQHGDEAPKAVIRPFDNYEEKQPPEPDNAYRNSRNRAEDGYQGKEVQEDPIVKEIKDTKVFQSFKPSLQLMGSYPDKRDSAAHSARENQEPVGQSDPTTGVMRIELIKASDDSKSLGICVTDEERDGQMGVYVKRLKRGGAADKDGRLKTGDHLLQANGVSLVGVDSREAVSILRDAKGKVVLTISRPESDNDLSYEDLKPDYDGDEDIEGLVEDAISTLSNEEQDNFEDRTEFHPVKSEGENTVLESNSTYNSSLQDGSGEAEEGLLKCPRDLPQDIPLSITADWLSGIPLVRRPEIEEEDTYTTDILQSLVEMVESGEPMEEFKNLRQLKEADSCDAGKMPLNKMKNRYRNILPYDGNRVKLESMTNGEDYINASYITVPVGKDSLLRYIACQGPLEETMCDFWSMLWQENTGVVLSLTKVMEGGKVKCHPYWPQSKDHVLELDKSARIVRLLESYSLDEFDVYHILQEDCKTGVCKSVTLLQHTSWPDHGAPDTALPLLKLLQVMHVYERGNRPVIHCSAGIGRTGALIAIDVSLATIEKEEQFDLYQIVSNLRSQRHGLIQTTDQYLFCYTACMEALLSLEMQDE